uniref:Uncharacterized protein n=1 Tax=Anguilla anguilla TaxID=7936 RepID=A0A0E9RQG8_ANGAN
MHTVGDRSPRLWLEYKVSNKRL